MSDLTDQLDGIQSRLDAAYPGHWYAEVMGEHRADVLATHEDGAVVICEHAGDEAGFIANAPTDIGFLLDLARKQQAALELAQWKLDALAGWAEAMIDQSHYPQYGRDVSTILGLTEADIAEQELADDYERNDHQ